MPNIDDKKSVCGATDLEERERERESSLLVLVAFVKPVL